MKEFTAVVERDMDTGLLVGWVPGLPGAHSQGESVEELRTNLIEVIEMLVESGAPHPTSTFIGTARLHVG